MKRYIITIEDGTTFTVLASESKQEVIDSIETQMQTKVIKVNGEDNGEQFEYD